MFIGRNGWWLTSVLVACSGGVEVQGGSEGDTTMGATGSATDEAMSSSGPATETGATDGHGGGSTASGSTGGSDETGEPVCGPPSGDGVKIDAIGFVNAGQQQFVGVAIGPGMLLTAVANVEVATDCEKEGTQVSLNLGGVITYPPKREGEIALARYERSEPYESAFVSADVIGGEGMQRAVGVAVDGSGTTYVAGVYRGNLFLPQQLGSGSKDVVIIDGPPLDSPDVHGFVVAYEESGDYRGHLQIGGGPGAGAWIESIAVNAAGELALAGTAHGSITLGLGGDCELGEQLSPFVVKFAGVHATQKAPLWAICPKSAGDEARARAVDIDEAGEVVATGFFRDELTWRDARGAELPDATVKAAGPQDLFVARWDAHGELQWHERCGAPPKQGASDDDAGYAVLADPSGRTFVAGAIGDTGSCLYESLGDYSQQSTGVLAARDAAGWAWERVVQLDPVASTTSAALTELARDLDGQIVVAGRASGPISFAGALRGPLGAVDALAAKLTCDGTLSWLQRFGSAPQRTVSFAGVAVDETALHFAGGYNAKFLDLPEPSTCPAGGSDAMLVKLGK